MCILQQQNIECLFNVFCVDSRLFSRFDCAGEMRLYLCHFSFTECVLIPHCHEAAAPRDCLQNPFGFKVVVGALDGDDGDSQFCCELPDRRKLFSFRKCAVEGLVADLVFYLGINRTRRCVLNKNVDPVPPVRWLMICSCLNITVI